MNKQNLQIKNFITPGDILAVLVVATGLIVAMFFEEIAIRMIGVSISILGAVALFMLISQRLNDVVESRYPKTGTPPPDFHVTTTQDASAKRQQVEDFVKSFGDEDDFPLQQPHIQNTDANHKTTDVSTKVNNKTAIHNSEVQYHDSISGMRIVGKVKANTQKENISAIQKSASDIENNSNRSNLHQTANLKTEIKKDSIENKQETIIAENVASAPIQEAIPLEKNDTKVSNTYNGKVVDIPLNVFIETDQILGDEPRKEFEFFMTRVLMIIRSATDTRTALFMLFNSQTNELILESFVTSVPLALKNKLTMKLDSDIISQIVYAAKPQILTEINPAAELDLIPYYNTATSTGSLIGVPVFWGEGIVGVLVADSESKNAYDAGTVAFLGHFTKLIGSLVRSYTHKFDLLQASKTLEAINTFYTIANSTTIENESISDIITESLKQILPNSANGTCGFDGVSDTWKVLSYYGSGKDHTGCEVDIENTLIGQCIYENKRVHLKYGEKVNLARINKDELALEGEFLCVPIKSKTQIYGAIFLETHTKDVFSEFDVSIIELIGDHAGNSIEKIYLMQSLNSSALYDNISGLLNPNALYRRLQEEMQRSKEQNLELSLCFFSFDRYASLDPDNFPERYTYTTQIVLERVKRYIKEYDLYGKVDDSTYGIVFLGRSAEKSRMSTERIRADVANTIIEFSGSSFSVTISMGLVSPSKDYDITDIIKNANTALAKAKESGNQVLTLY